MEQDYLRLKREAQELFEKAMIIKARLQAAGVNFDQ